MNEVVGCKLLDSLSFLQDNYDKIIKVEKIIGTNSKFNNLTEPYVVMVKVFDEYVKLTISYY